jgi:D-glycero-D-manno-heptose 1,7-bisphosphate phosphatase
VLENVVFLDRDGVINEDSPDYIKNWKEFHFLPGSLETLKKLHTNDFPAIVITNQSMIGRKISGPEDLKEIHRNMSDAVKRHGGILRDIFFCPHLPDGNCTCRKPKPGLILQAQEKYDIDLSTACMVGDSGKDIECALSAGLRHAILVRTGNGKRAELILKEKNIIPDYVAEDLMDAVEWILDTRHAVVDNIGR